MRLRLNLRPLERDCRLPINYQYPVSAWIYKILEAASHDYASQLHNGGYRADSGRHMKLFVFSRLEIARMHPEGRFLIAEDDSPCVLDLASPMLDFIENFVAGLFTNRQMEIGNKYTVARLQVACVEQLPLPDFAELVAASAGSEMPFSALSPLNVSVPRSEPGRPSLYLRPDDPDFSEAIRRNLVHKFTAAYGTKPTDDSLVFSWDTAYIAKRGGYDKISKLIWIKEGDRQRESKIKGFIAPFYLAGSPELMHCAYECGIGGQNSLGFGMIELAR